jgi:predicted DNA-binding transcriptional regulator AlpA
MADKPLDDPCHSDACKSRRSLKPLAVDARRLAKLLTLGLRTIRTMDSAGKLPAPVRCGARKLWIVREIRRWLRAGCPDRETWNHLRDTTAFGRKGVGQ